jgi:hypothetical protein
LQRSLVKRNLSISPSPSQRFPIPDSARPAGKKGFDCTVKQAVGRDWFFFAKDQKNTRRNTEWNVTPDSGRPLFGFPFPSASVRVSDCSGHETPIPLASRAIGLILFTAPIISLMSKIERKTNLWSSIHVPKTIIACGARFARRRLQNSIHE